MHWARDRKTIGAMMPMNITLAGYHSPFCLRLIISENLSRPKYHAIGLRSDAKSAHVYT